MRQGKKARTNAPFLLMPLRSQTTNSRPSSLLHLTSGLGRPKALHVSVAFDPSFTVTSELVISELMSGGTAIETMLKCFWPGRIRSWDRKFSSITTVKLAYFLNSHWRIKVAKNYSFIIFRNTKENYRVFLCIRLVTSSSLCWSGTCNTLGPPLARSRCATSKFCASEHFRWYRHNSYLAIYRVRQKGVAVC